MSVDFLQINKRIEISRMEDGLYYSTLIQDIDDESFNILVPYYKSMPLTLKPGDKVQVFVVGKNEGYEFITTVIRKTVDKIPLYVLEMPESMTRIQRRRFVRIPISLEVACAKMPLPGESLNFSKVITVDISAGGLKLIHKENISIGGKLILRLNLEHKHNVCDIRVTGRVVRSDVTDSPHGKYLLGIEFVDLAGSDRDKLAKYIFDKQVEFKKTGQVGM